MRVGGGGEIETGKVRKWGMRTGKGSGHGIGKGKRMRMRKKSGKG